MGASQRSKGARGEREAAHAIALQWCAPDCIRAACNGVEGADDIRNALPSASVEVKRKAGIAAARFMDQAKSQCRDGEIPVVVMREDGTNQYDKKDWLVMIRLVDSIGFAQRLASNRGTPLYPLGTVQETSYD